MTGAIDEVRIERDGAIAVLVVHRTRAHNAIARHTIDQLDACLDAVAADEAVRALVVTGGDGRFIAGGDLRDLGEARSADHGTAMSTRMQAVLARFERLPIPVIAAIEGYALGGGAEIALACDLRVMAADAVLAFRHRRFGVSTGWGATRRLERVLGRNRALEILWTGRDVKASEALSMGLIARVAPPGASRAQAIELARHIAEGAAGAIATTKTLVMRADLDRVAHGHLEASLFGEVWAHPDHWERMDAFFAERRARRSAAPKPTNEIEPAVPTTPERGRFIVLEGLDGAGTTTQAELLEQWLKSRGRTVVRTFQPSPGPVGTMIRHALARRVVGADGDRLDPRAIAALFAADRADHLTGVIEPALAAGHDVVCDRYLYSSLAYQGAETDPAWVAQLNAPYRAPDVVLYLEVPVEVAAARRAARKGTPDLYEVDDFLRRVADGYAQMSRWRPDDPVVVIDGARDVPAVQRDCRAAIEALE